MFNLEKLNVIFLYGHNRTYLNLGTEQFNSWVNEYENKYNQIEKTNISTISFGEKIEISENNSEIEESSDSEDEETSNVFISQQTPTKEEQLLKNLVQYHQEEDYLTLCYLKVLITQVLITLLIIQ